MKTIVSIEQLKQWVKKEYKNGTSIVKISSHIRHKYYHILLSYYKTEKIPPKDFIYSVLLNEPLVCEACGRLKTYHNNIKKLTCKRDCPATLEKKKKTYMKKYGVDNPMKNKEIRQKVIETNIERYGVDNPMKNESIKIKLRNIFKDKYNVDNPMKLEQFKQNYIQTNYKKYGKKHPMQNEKVKEKFKQTILEKYNVIHPLKSKEIKNKIISTNYAKYGTYHPMCLEETKERYRQTSLKCYGVEHHKCKDFSENALKFITDRTYAEKIIKKYKTLKNITDYLGISRNTVVRVAKEYELYEFLDLKKKCSCYEDEIEKYVKRYYKGKIKRNERKTLYPYEIDIYLPKLGLGIEFHGLYYHSELYKESDYHFMKFLKAKEKGISLIQIFEDDWVEKKEICRAIIRNRLGYHEKIIPARKCVIEKIDNKIYKKFLETYHIQGYAYAEHRYGLYHDDNLISVISFSRGRAGIGKKSSNSYEIVRYAVKFDIRIIGGFEKLLKRFIKDFCPEKIHTYVDNRLFDGHSLKRAGFEFVGYGKPNYWYITPNNIKRLHRYNFAKHQLVNKFGHMIENMENMTEREITGLLDFLKIHDAGHSKWVYHV